MLTHPVRDKATAALTAAGVDPMDVLLLIDDVCREDRNNRATLTYPQGRQYLVNVLTSMQAGIRLSDIEATATEAAEQISADALTGAATWLAEHGWADAARMLREVYTPSKEGDRG